MISSLGLLGTEDSVGLSGQSATSAVGSITASPETFANLAGLGLSSTSSVGDVDITSALILPISGQSATTSIGSISPADVMGLTGLSSTSAIGLDGFGGFGRGGHTKQSFRDREGAEVQN